MTSPSDIIFKRELELDEVKYVVEQYIKDKKGRDVKIVLRSEMGLFDPIEFNLLFNAFDIAARHYATI